jgi:G:T/U-mismatch repair DNA glycosylase
VTLPEIGVGKVVLKRLIQITVGTAVVRSAIDTMRKDKNDLTDFVDKFIAPEHRSQPKVTNSNAPKCWKRYTRDQTECSADLETSPTDMQDVIALQ